MPARSATHLAELWRTDGPPWPEVRTLALAVDLARSLAALHKSGLHLPNGVHPACVAIDREGRCHWDLPAVSGGSAEVGPQADVYGFGVLLLVALSGLPAQAVVAAMARRVRPSALVGRRLAPGFEFLLGRCLSVHPNRRYRSGVELWADLTAYAARHGPFPAPGLTAKPIRPTWRKRLGIAAAGFRRSVARWRGFAAWAMALLLVGGVAFVITYGTAGRQARLRLPPRLQQPRPEAGTPNAVPVPNVEQR